MFLQKYIHTLLLIISISFNSYDGFGQIPDNVRVVDKSVMTPEQQRDGKTWGNAYGELWKALDYVREHPEDAVKEIWIAKGTYLPDTNLSEPREASFYLVDGVDIYGGFEGGEESLSSRKTDPLYLYDTNATVLSGSIGQDSNVYHILIADSLTKLVKINGFIITSGKANKNIGINSVGGGLYAVNSTLALESCIFKDNIAVRQGGGLFSDTSKIDISQCRFINNRTLGGSASLKDGGAALTLNGGNSTIIDCEFKDNYSNNFGGGMLILDNESGEYTINNCQFVKNRSAADGGSIYAYSGEIKVFDSEFMRSYAKANGGGIYSQKANLSIDGCNFLNSESNNGGAIYFSDISEQSITKCTLANNTASQGGAIYNEKGTPVISESEFKENSANFGGGIYLENNITLNTCTFQSNYGKSDEVFIPSYGGAIYCNGGDALLIEHCDFLKNTAAIGGAIFNTLGTGKIAKSKFRENTATGTMEFFGIPPMSGLGGAFYHDSEKRFLLEFCVFEKNGSNNGKGGGVWTNSRLSLTISHSGFYHNWAAMGGGIYNEGKLNLTNNTFSANDSSEQIKMGGAIYNNTNDSLNIAYCTITQNAANEAGGGIFNVATNSLNIYYLNSIIADNQSPRESDISGRGISFGYNIIGITDSGIEFDSTDIIHVSNDSIGLMPLVYRGGPPIGVNANDQSMLIHGLDSNSIALSAGIPVEEASFYTDQRGYSRVKGSTSLQIDIGAFEQQTTFVKAPFRALCANSWLSMESIILIDSTGGAWLPAASPMDTQRLVITIPPELELKPDIGSVTEEFSEGITILGKNIKANEIEIFYNCKYHTGINSIRLDGLLVRPKMNPPSDSLYFYLEENNSIQTRNIPLAKILVLPSGNISYEEDFEGSKSIWLAKGNEERTTWEWTNASIRNGKIWITNAEGSYKAKDTSWVESGCFDLRSLNRPMIGLDIWFDTEENFDGAVLQISTDAGDTWETLGSFDGMNPSGPNWYNSLSIIANPGEQDAERWGWTGREAKWMRATHQLDQYKDSSAVRFRIAFGSTSEIDTTKSNGGFAFDNIFIGERSRRVLLEYFEGSSPTCHNILTENEDVFSITYALDKNNPNYSFDPAVGNARALYYGMSSPEQAVLGGDDFNDTIPNLQNLALTYASLSEAGLIIQPLEIIPDGNELKVHVQIKLIDTSLLKKSLWVYAVLTETENNCGFPKNLVRTFLPHAGGMPLSFNNDTIWNYTYDTEAWKPCQDITINSPGIAVFVQERKSKKIYQSSFSRASAKVEKKVCRLGTNRRFPKLFPNPANTYTQLWFDETLSQPLNLELVDIRGRIIKKIILPIGNQSYHLKTSDLVSGVYFLMISNKSKAFILRKKLSVIH